MRPVVLVKLGGSLITLKDRPDTPRPGVIDRLAREIAEAWPNLEGGLILGHGSGSFGHAAAHDVGLLGDGASGRARLSSSEGLARMARGAPDVQRKAAELHALVMAALREVDLPAFSIAPSSGATASEARILSFQAQPFALALSGSLLPVTYGDVVMDRERGASILSTETVLAGLADSLPDHGWAVERAIWLGETDGIYDAEGVTVSRVSASLGERLRHSVGGSGATDVTGGMAHRLDTALALAAQGVRSWIGDGTREGVLARALIGEEVGGTVVPAAA
ncbi:MAG: isopentenyl phosphate kinase [Gemmatimonadales bacterium]|jgi:isopentenyl phosphate kinase